MFMYNWTKIYDITGGSAVEITRLVRMVINKQIPDNKFDPIYRYYGQDYSGESFLVHPDMLMYNAHKHSHKDICQYLALASLRPIADYLASGLVSIPIECVPIEPDSLLAYVQQNELLALESGVLKFRYEEISEQTVH